MTLYIFQGVSPFSEVHREKVIARGEEGGRKRVPFSRSHRDKRFYESDGSIFIQFVSEGVLGVRNQRVSSLGGNITSSEKTPW